MGLEMALVGSDSRKTALRVCSTYSLFDEGVPIVGSANECVHAGE